jgi:hypothetical protein
VADARWIERFEERTQECIDAALDVALEPPVRTWPFYLDHPWNPGGHPLSRKEPPEKIFDPELHDERTLKEPRVDRRGSRPR